jgi:hypothetical protein
MVVPPVGQQFQHGQDQSFRGFIRGNPTIGIRE